MVTGWHGIKGTKRLEGDGCKTIDDFRGPVLCRTSRNKIQGVAGSGEPRGIAKANARSVEQGAAYESAYNHYHLTRSRCDLHRTRLKPI